jgi:RNA recognition motif-containing protein
MENRTIYVANIPYSARTEDIRTHFEDIGEIRNCVLIQKKGIAFVEYAQRETAERALEEKQGTDIGGRPVRLDWAKPRSDNPHKNNEKHRPRPRRQERA